MSRKQDNGKAVGATMLEVQPYFSERTCAEV